MTASRGQTLEKLAPPPEDRLQGRDRERLAEPARTREKEVARLPVGDEAKRVSLPDCECLSAKDEKKLKKLREGKPLHDALTETLSANVTDKVWCEPTSFPDHLTQLAGRGLRSAPLDRALPEIIAKGLSTPDPKAEIQRDRNGVIICDADLKDTATGFSVPHISPFQVGNFKVAIPPPDEQLSISACIGATCARVDAIMARRKRQLDRLDALKRSLAYEHVTGRREA